MSNIKANKTAGSSEKKAEPKKTNKRSKVWDEFIYEETPDGRKRAKCIHCENYLSGDSKSGTTHLKRHLEQACTKRMKKQERNNSVFDQERNLDLFTKMVIHGKIPLQYVENPLFTEFARSLQPMYTHVDRVAVEKRCLAYYENEKKKVQDEFIRLTSRVNIVIDTIAQFICVTAQFIDDNFNLVKRLIGFKKISVLTREACIQAEVEKCINFWGLGRKMLQPVWRNSNYWRKSLLRSKESFVYVQLFGPSLCRIASYILHKIPPMLRNLNVTPEQMKIFNQIVKEHNLANIPERIFYVSDTWVSIFKPCDVLGYEDVFNEMFKEKCVSREAWSKVERAFKILALVYSVLSKFSNERTTSNIFFEIILQILGDLDKLLEEYDIIETRELISEFKKVLYEFLVDCDKMLFVASVLDPRYKSHFLDLCYQEVIPKLVGHKEEISGFLENLYKDYERESKKHTTVSLCSGISELDKYLKEDCEISRDVDFDVLGWWKDNKLNYPILSMMARDILAIPLASHFLPFGEYSFDESWPYIRSFEVGIKMQEALIFGNDWMNSGYIAGVVMCNTDGTKSHETTSTDGIRKAQKSQIIRENPNHREVSKELLMKLIIQNELSFNFSENPSFIEWANFLHPLYIPLQQDYIREGCFSDYKKQRKMLQNEFSKLTSGVCLSVRGFSHGVCIGAHFVDDDFNLVRKIIGLSNSDLKGFANKLLTCTYEDKYLEGANDCIKWHFFSDVNPISVYCAASSLIWTAEDIMSFHIPLIESIRMMISHVAENQNIMNVFNQNAEMCQVARKEDFVLDDFGRWDSSFIMLHDAINYKDVFDACRLYDRNFKYCQQWGEVEMLVKLLKPIYEAIIMLSSLTHSTSNLVLETFIEIYDMFLETSTALEMRMHIYHPMYILHKYLKNCDILLVASILDPRLKSHYVGRCYLEGIALKENIDKLLEDLCEKYEMDESRLELKKYLIGSDVDDADPNFSVLSWWKGVKSEYPVLSRMARDILAIPASSILCHPTFVRYGTQNIMEALVCSKNWIDAKKIMDGSPLGSSVVKLSAIDSTKRHVSPFHRGLSVREVAAFEYVKEHVNLSVFSTKELVLIKDGSLTVEDMKCLTRSTSEDIHDDFDKVLNCCINILNSNSTKIFGRHLLSYIVSTLESRSLCLLPSSSVKENMKVDPKTWSSIIETVKSFSEYDLVFFPINIKNEHWFVVVLNSERKEFQILNSIESMGDSCLEITYNLWLGIQACIDAAMEDLCPELESELEDPQYTDWSISVMLNIPQQKDRCSSGFYALKYMHLWRCDEVEMNFSQEYINIFRKKLVAELIFSELNELEDIKREVEMTIKQ